MIQTNKLSSIQRKVNGNSLKDKLKEEKKKENEMVDVIENNEQEEKDDERNTEKEKEIIETKENIENHEYTTRDLSWLNFNTRILKLAKNKNIPLFERFKFLGISSSNLDEFTTVRIAKLLSKSNEINIMGIENIYEVKELQKRINNNFLPEQEIIFKELLNELKELTGYEFVSSKKELAEEEKDFLKKYFDKNIKALINPIVADTNKPFPIVENKSLNMAIIVEDNRFDDNSNLFATIKVPSKLPRVIKIEPEIKKYTEEEKEEINKKNKERNVSVGKKLILLEDLIKLNLSKIFVGKNIKSVIYYRLLRDLNYKVSKNDFIVNVMKETLKRRDDSGNVIRLEVTNDKKSVMKIFKKAFGCENKHIHEKEVLDLSFCMKLSKLFNDNIVKENSYKDFYIRKTDDILDDENIFDLMDEEDIICHHPFDSYDIVIDFINEAAKDKDVVSIRQTLYRVADNSKIVNALIKAAEKGKDVTVILEPTARFDEANNLECASRLEAAGANVIYGISGIKVHAKMCLITKLKSSELYQYVHIGTGNYNENNSKIYTDISLFTTRKNITNDVSKLFNAITGFSEPDFKKILVPNYNMREKLIELIDNEIKAHNEQKGGEIIIKCNALTDREIMDKLVEASTLGVKVTLIVRSSCGIYTVNRNMIIKSEIGRFLEHSRIWYFENADNRYYIGSSDLMPRNLNNRIEIMVPIDKDNYNKIKKILDAYVYDYSEYMDINSTQEKLIDNNTNAQEKFMNNHKPKDKLENVSKIFTTRK